ncbi:MAG: long-chain fatty acid--CoA ligase, partial [Acidimicrobiales bacterium]|nr:long-chain fatty acid--CoA ligase [Acidimicrobiales bacterium]
DVRAAASADPPSSWPRLEPSDPVAVVWTSGTTGLPKGAVFDHDNLRAVADGTDVLSHPGGRRLSPLPFAHVGSMTRLWDEAVHRVTTVITPTPWRAAAAVSVMVGERITVAQGVPTQWALVLEEPGLDGADLAALRIVGTGAARVPPELVAALQRRLGVPVVVRYTSTEASLGTGTRPGDAADVVATTVGRPVPGVELEIAGHDGDEMPADVGQVGRVRLRSGAVMRGYWGGPPSGPGAEGLTLDVEATRAVLDEDGWLTTGDLGALDAAGNLHLAGRSTEMYIRGGYNVYPAEVEAVLGGHPDVEAVAVLSAPDPVLGEVGVAVVVPVVGAGVDPGRLLAELRAVVADRLADYKSPDQLALVDALPLTPMMKVDKAELAERLARGLPVEAARGAPAATGARSR